MTYTSEQLEKIIQKASERQITITAHENKIRLIAPDKSYITDDMRVWAKTHKSALLDYFADLAAREAEEVARFLAEYQEQELCSICFEPACGEPGPNNMMYCAEHHPVQLPPAIDPGSEAIA